MNQAEYLGAQLVMLIRREYEQQQELKRTQDKINDAYVEIQTMDAGVIYQSTGEIPVVRLPHEMPTEIRPLRGDRTDGGHTYNLAAIAETLNLPAVAPCEPECLIEMPHVHYVNGTVVRLQEYA